MKPFPNNPNYSVTTDGEVFSHFKNCFLKQHSYEYSPYPRVVLQGKTWTVHRIVALTYLSDTYQENFEVNHKNKVKTDNRVENLEWVSRQDNLFHMRNFDEIRFPEYHWQDIRYKWDIPNNTITPSEN